jgi:aminopeptidase N
MGFGAIASGQAPAQVVQILEWLSVLTDESFFLTQVPVVIALGQMETPRATSKIHFRLLNLGKH